MTLLGQAAIIEGNIPNMITFGFFASKFFILKKQKYGLNAWIEKKSREKSLDLNED